MAIETKTISELTQVTELNDESLFVAEQDGVAVSVPASVLKNSIEAASDEELEAMLDEVLGASD